MTTTAEHMMDVLSDAGIEYVFGVPGGGTVFIYTAMFGRESGPVALLTRQEHGAAVMADAYARASGRPAVIMGQGAFIVANGAFGLTEAFTSSSPMILIGDLSDFGTSPRPVGQSMTGDWGSPDAIAMLRAMTKYTAVASTPKEAVLGLQMAIKHAVSGCPGPTAVMIKSDAIAAEVDEGVGPAIYERDRDPRAICPEPARSLVTKAVEIVSEARQPVLVAGKGVHNAFAHSQLRRLAERWAMPVGTTYKGKSAIAESHPLALGMVGTYGRPLANEVVHGADAVVVVGAKLRSNDTAGGSILDAGRQHIVQIDIETLNANWALPAEVTLVGDARTVLERMLEESDRYSVSGEALEARRVSITEIISTDPLLREPDTTRDTAPVLPQRLARLLEEHLDPSSNISLDAGNNRLWIGLFTRAQREHSYFAPGGLAGMGWAMPAALGVKLARPGQPSVAVTGDGGFMMSVHALSTATEIPMVTIVMNDSGLGMVRQHQADRAIASTFPPTDHAAIARGFGLDGFRVEHAKELPDALKAAQSSGRSAVVDVIIDKEVSPDLYRARARAISET